MDFMRLIDFMFDAELKYQSLPQIEHGCLTQKKTPQFNI
jgi:hypothetical protein